jgi:hypothetical protein
VSGQELELGVPQQVPPPERGGGGRTRTNKARTGTKKKKKKSNRNECATREKAGREDNFNKRQNDLNARR